MNDVVPAEGYRLFLATTAATPRERLVAVIMAAAALLLFVALLPFVRVPLAP